MNNNNRLLALTLGSLTLSLTATAITFTSFRQGPVAHIPAPPATDSTVVNRFSAEHLLSARKAFTINEMQNWTTVTTDTAGRVLLAKTNCRPELSSFGASLRAERFAKGKLKITTPAMAEVSLNGKSVIKKTSADSIAVSKDVSVTLNPEVTYSVDVRILSNPDDKGKDASFSLEFIPDKEYEGIGLDMRTDSRRRFEIEDINLGRRVAWSALSPSGKYLYLRYSEMLAKDKFINNATILETTTGRIVANGVNSSAAWMPASDRLYYFRKDLETYTMMTIDVPTMSEKVLARDLQSSGYTVAPTEKYLVGYENIDGKKEEGVMKRYTSPDDRIPGNRDRRYLTRYDLESGLTTPLTFGGASTTLTDIARDGSKLLYIAMTETPDRFPFYDAALIELDVNTLKTDTLRAGETYLTNAVYSPDASKVFITGGPSVFDGIGINNGGAEIPNDFDEQGYILDIKTRQVKAMTRDFDPSLTGTPVWNARNGKIYFRAAEGFNTPLFCLDPTSGSITRLPVESGTVNSFSIGKNEDTWISYVAQSFTDIGAAWLINLRNGKARLVDDPMKERIGQVAMGRIEPWIYTHSDNTIVDGIICYPPEFDESKKYPLIVYYYAGTTPSNSTMHHPYTPQLFASRNYVVYIPNPSGTYGYGQEFSSRHVNAWGIRTADEIIGGVKEFCKTHTFVDKDKIGCIGASYGGFMTQYLQTRTDIFAAAVSHAGISNVTSYWGEGYWGYSYNAVAAARSYPWSDPELFTKQGSLFNADKIHTPLLLLHGTRDTNVPVGESIQIFNALKILGREVEFITVDDQDHIINDYEKRKLWQNTIMAWFAKWLQDDPKWWNSLYGDK